jgi:flagellar hook-associated protein 3 FlgL
MSINSLGYNGTALGQAVLNINTQLTNLSTEMASGEKSTTYAGMGVNEGFAIAARSQLASISAFTDTMSNVNTTISAANTALQALSTLGGQVQNYAASSPGVLDSTGQTTAQETAGAELSSMIGILNTQSGDRYVFSGTAINTPPTATVGDIINGTTSQAGLKQVIAERAQADGTTGLGRLVLSPSTSSPITISEDSAVSPFGMKLNSVSSTLTGATVTGPAGSPASVSIALGATNPNPGDQVSFTFNLPDGTTDSFQLTASSANPPPAGSFSIGTTPSATSANLNAALNTAIGTMANTSLVAASAVEAGNDFFGSASASIGTAKTNQATAPVPVTGATLLSGAAGTNSLASGFTPGSTITVNGTTISFNNTGTTGSATAGTLSIDVGTGSVGDVLAAIDAISGTSAAAPSTISGGVITLNDDAGPLSITSSVPASLTALGFSGNPVTTTGGTAAGTLVNSQFTGPPAPPAPAPISGTTLLAGAAGTNSLTTSFASGDSITVNGQHIQFYNSGGSSPTAAGNTPNTTYLDLATTTVGSLLGTIDSLTGTPTPSSVHGGVVTLQSNNGAPLTVSSTNSAAFQALGFSGGTTTAALPPLRVGGSPLSSATALISGTPANTVTWYTGNSGPGSARASSSAVVDQSVTVQYGAQANEQAIRSQLQSIAVFAAFTAPAKGTNSAAQIAALSQRTATNLTPQPGQQTIEDIQSDFAAAQTTMKDATARQTQSQNMLQNMISTTETISPDQVASEILALQNSLQAAYQTTSMLSQLSLTKFLPAGG